MNLVIGISFGYSGGHAEMKRVMKMLTDMGIKFSPAQGDPFLYIVASAKGLLVSTREFPSETTEGSTVDIDFNGRSLTMRRCRLAAVTDKDLLP